MLSGINLGSNLGNSIWHSGTLAAAKQAALLGLRGIALSTPTTDTEPDFETLKPWVPRVLDLLLPARELPLVNVNLPAVMPRGVLWTRQSVRHYDGKVVPGKDPMGRTHLLVHRRAARERGRGHRSLGDRARLRVDDAAAPGSHRRGAAHGRESRAIRSSVSRSTERPQDRANKPPTQRGSRCWAYFLIPPYRRLTRRRFLVPLLVTGAPFHAEKSKTEANCSAAHRAHLHVRRWCWSGSPTGKRSSRLAERDRVEQEARAAIERKHSDELSHILDTVRLVAGPRDSPAGNQQRNAQLLRLVTADALEIHRVSAIRADVAAQPRHDRAHFHCSPARAHDRSGDRRPGPRSGVGVRSIRLASAHDAGDSTRAA